MPIIQSAKKALRASKKKKVYNTRRKADYENEIKTIRKMVKDGKLKEAEKELANAYKAIDKAFKTKILKKNTAARKKSRLTILVNKAKATK